jgi:hypothetical protein
MSMPDRERFIETYTKLQESLTDFARMQSFPSPYFWAQEAVVMLTGHLMRQLPPQNGYHTVPVSSSSA